MQAGIYLVGTRGLTAPEARICYERAESFCHSLNRPRLLYVALTGQWRYSLVTGKLTTTMQLANNRVYSLAKEQNDSASLTRAFMAHSAAQVEFDAMIGDEGLHPLQKAVPEFQEFCLNFS